MKYSLGLDIGTTSIGWAVVNEDKQRIEDVGVRIFERPENPKNGESLAKPRRDARSTRRRLSRRRQRLNYLKRFFIQHKLLTDAEIKELFLYDRSHTHKNPYELRAKAICEKVPNDELFVALYHIAKRRGYKSNRKAVEEKDKENGRVLKAIKENQPLLGQHNFSVAQTLLEDEKFAKHKRNKNDDYTNSFIRSDFEREIVSILKTQNWSEEEINELLYSNPNKPETLGQSGIFFQRPFMTDELIKKMRGKCQFEKDEPRAPRASYSFELFRLAQDLSHLSYNDGQKLTPEEIAKCVEQAKSQKSVTYKTIHKLLAPDKNTQFDFDYIRGKQKKDEDKEKNAFANLKFYHAVKDAYKNHPDEWVKLQDDVELFDQIGTILTENKDDEALLKKFQALSLPEDIVKNLMSLSFSGFGHLSLKALRKITPHLLEGMTYDKAVELSYPGQFTQKLHGDKNQLPPLSEDEANQLTNPVVKRAISQTRKVVNAIIKKYGAPHQIKVETANDLAKNFKDRRDIIKQQQENQERNEKAKKVLQDLGFTAPTGQQIIKYKLREQQAGQCAYCGSPLDLDDDSQIEVDHIIPFSRCGNDGFNNKVLVCSRCNQEKADRTPYEKWGHDAKRWSAIEAIAKTLPEPKQKRILCQTLPKEDWHDHAMNDTRYISRFLCKYFRNNLRFDDSSEGEQKVISPSGHTTSYLRKIYGVGSKDRDLNNCHHAADACIIATVTQDQIRKVSLWNKYKELGARTHPVSYVDENGNTSQVTKTEYENLHNTLEPWENFAKEVRIRTGMTYDSGKIEKLADFRDKFRQFSNYDEDFLKTIHPLFVSRMPKRGLNGKIHEETLRSPKVTNDGRRTVRKRLNSEFAKNYLECVKKGKPQSSYLEASVLPESDQTLYRQLKSLLDEKGEHAFDEPIYKNDKTVDKNGNPLSPVTTIKVYEKKPNTSGVYLNHNTQFADNGKTICLNIYRRKMANEKYKFFAAPLYAHSLNKKAIPILPAPTDVELEYLASRDNGVLARQEDGFERIAQIFPNDYVRIVYPERIIEGYYVKYGTAVGQLTLMPHNRADKSGTLPTCCLGKATDVKVIPISVLGDNYEFQ